MAEIKKKQQPYSFKRKLGNTTYTVKVHFSKDTDKTFKDSLLSAMERAGTEDMGDDVERKGLGTPATRADIIEKLVKDVSRAMGEALTDSRIKSMLEGKKTLVKDLKGKKGNYDAYLIPEGIEDYSYTKDGKEIKGFQYKVKLEFPKKNSEGIFLNIGAYGKICMPLVNRNFRMGAGRGTDNGENERKRRILFLKLIDIWI